MTASAVESKRILRDCFVQVYTSITENMNEENGF